MLEFVPHTEKWIIKRKNTCGNSAKPVRVIYMCASTQHGQRQADGQLTGNSANVFCYCVYTDYMLNQDTVMCYVNYNITIFETFYCIFDAVTFSKCLISSQPTQNKSVRKTGLMDFNDKLNVQNLVQYPE
jgi:hypothetical protein